MKASRDATSSKRSIQAHTTLPPRSVGQDAVWKYRRND
jgi:hypothetical protein